jgi:hypothetical protein
LDHDLPHSAGSIDKGVQRAIPYGTLTLNAGRHVVRWTVIGEADVPPVFQTVVVDPGLQAGQGIVVGDRATVGIVRSAESGPAGMISLSHAGILLAGSVTQFTSVNVPSLLPVLPAFPPATGARTLRVGNDTQLLCNPGSAVGGQL